MKKALIIVAILAITAIASLLAYNYFSDSPLVNFDKKSKTVVDANNNFAFDFYSQYKSADGNIFFSPYSISTALAMTYEGAKGETASEMAEVFYYPEDATVRRDGFKNIYNLLNRKNNKYTLKTANALWAEEEFKFADDYFKVIDEYYGGKVTNLDFKNESEKSRETINTWVEDNTNNKINDLLPQGSISPGTRLVLTNAVYFKGDWLKQFNEDDTQNAKFYTNSDKTVDADMMSRTDDEAKFDYAENDLLQIIRLPYSGEDLSMVILLPKNKELEKLEDELTLINLENWESKLKETRVNIYIPRFKFETKSNLKDTLTAMGMPNAFEDTADFSGMTGISNLKIDEVIHQAVIEVNEEGTEAAAATAVVMVETTAFDPGLVIPTFRADHPFIFFIKENNSDSILFMGRVIDPTAE